MKIFTVDFKPVWPVGCALIIAAEDITQAEEIAKQTIAHTSEFSITEIDISEPKVVLYNSGEY